MSAAPETALSSAYAECASQLRENEPDAWLAALFAPAGLRPHLHALHSFAAELAGVAQKVSQPLLGEMRLQWWRDALLSASEGARANPLAHALLDTMERRALPIEIALEMIDANVATLYDDPFANLGALEANRRASEGSLLRLCALALGASEGMAERALDDAGVALGLTRLMRPHGSLGARYAFLPDDLLARHGGPPLAGAGIGEATLRGALGELRRLARDRLADARAHAGALGDCAAALLPAAVVPLYLDAMERRDYDPYAASLTPPQWRRQWALWRAARRGGL